MMHRKTTKNVRCTSYKGKEKSCSRLKCAPQTCYAQRTCARMGIKMIKIMFVCLGNICRSPMAEFVFRDMLEKEGISDRFVIASCATSTEEIGNPVHPGTKRKLMEHGISVEGKHAVQLQRKDYDEYDYLLAMEERNIVNIKRIIKEDSEHKVHRLLDFSEFPRDIADPWYTGNFDKTYDDVVEGCKGFLKFLKATHGINQ